MTCNACGEHPKKHCGCKDCTKAVLEITNPEKIVLLRKVVIPASMGDDTTVPATLGKYCNVVLWYEANKHTYLYSSDGIPTLLEAEVPQEIWDRIGDLEEDVDGLETNLGNLEQEFEDFKNNPDVVDIVATYADLEAYDTSTLTDQDIIRVLADETHDGSSAYYRWNKTNSQWTFIGVAGPYYTKSETDTLLGGKLGTGTTFWGQTVNNGVVSGAITLDDTTGMKIKFANGKLFIQNNTSVDIAVSGTNGMDNKVDFAMSTLASIQDGVSDTDAVNVRQLNKTVRIAPASDTPPTQSTVGKVGSLYTVVNSGVPEVYMCTAVSGSTYTWELTGSNAFTTNEWNALWA